MMAFHSPSPSSPWLEYFSTMSSHVEGAGRRGPVTRNVQVALGVVVALHSGRLLLEGP